MSKTAFTPELVKQATEYMLEQHHELSSTFHTLRQEGEQLLATGWRSPAGNTQTAAFTQWSEGMSEVLDGLAQLQHATEKAHTNLKTQDENNRDGLLSSFAALTTLNHDNT